MFVDGVDEIKRGITYHFSENLSPSGFFYKDIGENKFREKIQVYVEVCSPSNTSLVFPLFVYLRLGETFVGKPFNKDCLCFFLYDREKMLVFSDESTSARKCYKGSINLWVNNSSGASIFLLVSVLEI